MKMRFSAIVLAAGESARFGTDKLSLTLGPRSILEHTVGQFYTIGITEIIIVTGRFAYSIPEKLTPPKIHWIHNPDYSSGMSSSVRSGIGRIDPSSDAVFITPADIPLFKSDTIRQMMAGFSTKKIIIPVHRGQKGHPVLLSTEIAKKCLFSQSEKVLYDVIREHTDAVTLLPVEDEGVVLDMDTAEDYEALKKYYANCIKQ